jgi:hypothetical protein
VARRSGNEGSASIVARRAACNLDAPPRVDRVVSTDESASDGSDPLQALIAKWTDELQRHKAVPAFLSGEHVVMQVLRDLENMRHSRAEQILSLAEAAAESGYSQAHLGRLVRAGTIPDRRPEGGRGRLWFFRSDLPRKPASPPPAATDIAGLEDLWTK